MMARPAFGDLSLILAPPVPMAYAALHPVCGHDLAVVPDRGPMAAHDAAALAPGLELARLPLPEAQALATSCGTCHPPAQDGLGL